MTTPLPAFAHPGTAGLLTTPLKGLLAQCRKTHLADIREAITHCQAAPLKNASRLDILASAVKRRGYLRG